MKRIRWLKEWRGSKIGEIGNAGQKSAENFVSQGFAEYVDEEPPKKVKDVRLRRIVMVKDLPDKLAGSEHYIGESSAETWVTQGYADYVDDATYKPDMLLPIKKVHPLIPPRLRKRAFRFVRCGYKSKNPKTKEMDYQTTNNYQYDDEKLYEHIAEGNNYGVLGGFGNLLIIDYDCLETHATKQPLLPPTFQAKSGSGKYHAFYFVDDTKSWVVDKKVRKVVDGKETEEYEKTVNKDGKEVIKTRRLCDMQGARKYVIAPGSIHPDFATLPNGGKYETHIDVPIATTTIAHIREVFRDLLPAEEFVRNLDDVKPKHCRRNDYVRDEIKRHLRVSQQLAAYGCTTKGSKANTGCPFHEDTTNHALSYDDNKNGGVWHCFDCRTSGDVFSLIMEYEKKDFIEVKNELKKKLNIFDKDEQRIIESLKKKSETHDNDFITLQANARSALKANELDTVIELITNHIMNKYHFITLRNDESQEMWFYDETTGTYVTDGKTYIQQIVDRIIGIKDSETLANKIAYLIRMRTFHNRQEFLGEHNVDLICLKNGIYNIEDGTLIPHTPNYIFFNQVNVTYDPNATCPKISTAIRDMLPENDASLIEEMFGFILYRNYFINRIFILTGTGANGKSQIIKLIKRFVGDGNWCAITPQQITESEFMRSELFGKLVCLAADVSSNDMKNTGILKSLSGEDPLTANRKYKTSLNFTNYAKLVFAMNQIPHIEDDTAGMMRRLAIIDFREYFYSEDECAEMPEDQRNAVKHADTNLIEKIGTDEELSGLFNVAIKKLKKLQERGSFTNSRNTEDIKTSVAIKSNSIGSFIESFLIADPYSRIKKDDLRHAYHLYCRKHNVSYGSDVKLKKELMRTFHELQTTQFREGKERVWAWQGIKWTDDDSDSVYGQVNESKTNFLKMFSQTANKPVDVTTVTGLSQGWVFDGVTKTPLKEDVLSQTSQVSQGFLTKSPTENSVVKTSRIHAINLSSVSAPFLDTPVFQEKSFRNPVTPPSNVGVDENNQQPLVSGCEDKHDNDETVEGTVQNFHQQVSQGCGLNPVTPLKKHTLLNNIVPKTHEPSSILKHVVQNIHVVGSENNGQTNGFRHQREAPVSVLRTNVLATIQTLGVGRAGTPLGDVLDVFAKDEHEQVEKLVRALVSQGELLEVTPDCYRLLK
jgi:putative DNA primase/helicase